MPSSIAPGQGGAEALSSLTFLQNGAGAVPRTALNKMQEILSVKDFGAKGDGVTDDTAAIQNALNAATNTTTIFVPFGLYIISAPLKLTTPGLTMAGEVDAFTYGLFPAGVRFRFTSVGKCFDTYINPGDPTNVPYIRVSDVVIDGNGVGTIGFDGGYLTDLERVVAINCTTAGLRLGALSQTSTFERCAFNGNLDGILSLSAGLLTTCYFKECITRQNTRYGINGAFPTCTFKNHIAESNGSQGANITGFSDLLKFEGYFEQNDAASGGAGYNLRFATTGVSQGIVFENTKFGSTVNTNIANIVSGRVTFRNCSQDGDVTSLSMTVAAGAEVVSENSFVDYNLPANVKIVLPQVAIDPLSALKFTDLNDFIVINTPPLILGVADFSMSFVYAPDTTNNAVRAIVGGPAGALQLLVSGSANGVYNLSFFVAGGAAFHTTLVGFQANQPTSVVYVRATGVGFLYIDGVLIDSFADANNYTATEATMGSDNISTFGAHGNFYAFSFFGAALTAQNAFDLWRTAGNPATAKIGGQTLNVNFQRRAGNFVWETVNAAWLAFNGAGLAWLNTTPFPMKPAAAIASPAAPGVVYAQSDAQSMKVAVDAIRTALTAAGITL